MEKFRNISSPGVEYTLEQVIAEMLAFIREDDELQYKVIVGTDSLHRSKRTCFSTAIIIHRVGKSARFWYSKYYVDKYPRDIVVRIMKETADSIEIMVAVKDSELSNYITDEDLEIHIDAGSNGDSVKVVHQALSYVKAMGFNGEAKPDSAIATNVADRFTGHS